MVRAGIAFSRNATHLDTKDQPTLIACLFGDEAANTLGYTPLGLSERTGFALALHDARLELFGER